MAQVRIAKSKLEELGEIFNVIKIDDICYLKVREERNTSTHNSYDAGFDSCLECSSSSSSSAAPALRRYRACAPVSTAVSVDLVEAGLDPNNPPTYIDIKVNGNWTLYFDGGLAIPGEYEIQDDPNFENLVEDTIFFPITSTTQVDLVISGVSLGAITCWGDQCELTSATGLNGSYSPTAVVGQNPAITSPPACGASQINNPANGDSSICRVRVTWVPDADGSLLSIVPPTNLPVARFTAHSSAVCTGISFPNSPAHAFVDLFIGAGLWFRNFTYEAWLTYSPNADVGQNWFWTFHLSYVNGLGSNTLLDDGRWIIAFNHVATNGCSAVHGILDGCSGARVINQAYSLAWSDVFTGGTIELQVTP